MLTETDTHYIAGALLMLAKDNVVTVELGARIPDLVTESDRDIDVHLTTQLPTDGTIGFSGIEVKDHSRRLDIVHIEQLVLKLLDAEDLTGRGIVSSSGYTDTAIKKCSHYGVTPYELKDWHPGEEQLAKVNIADDFSYVVQEAKFLEGSQTRFYFESDPYTAEDLNHPSFRSLLDDGADDPQYAGLDKLSQAMQETALNSLSAEQRIALPAEPTPVAIRLTFELPRLFESRGKMARLIACDVEGTVTNKTRRVAPQFKRLCDARTDESFAGCTVAELPDGALVGMFVGGERDSTFMYLTKTERDRRTIRKKRLR